MTVPIPIIAGALLLAAVAGAAILALVAERQMARRIARCRADRDLHLVPEPDTSPTGRIAAITQPVGPLTASDDSGEWWPRLAPDWDDTVRRTAEPDQWPPDQGPWPS